MAVVQAAFAPFIGRTRDKATIGEIASALSDTYGKGDVALYTIVVPQQNLSDGVLTLRVVEGYIDDVVITGDVKGRGLDLVRRYAARLAAEKPLRRSEEHTSELQSLMRISYAVFCLKKTKIKIK